MHKEMLLVGITIAIACLLASACVCLCCLCTPCGERAFFVWHNRLDHMLERTPTLVGKRADRVEARETHREARRCVAERERLEYEDEQEVQNLEALACRWSRQQRRQAARQATQEPHTTPGDAYVELVQARVSPL